MQVLKVYLHEMFNDKGVTSGPLAAPDKCLHQQECLITKVQC